MGETKVVDDEHSEGRTYGTGEVEGQIKVTETLSPMVLRADISDQRICGSQEECESDSLKKPHDQKGPKGRNKKIGNGSEGEKEGASNHKVFFMNF
jgi:hypothetical protein